VDKHSLFDWISVLGPILFSWPLLVAAVVALFYRPLFKLLEKASDQEVQKAKIGPFEIEETEEPYVESLKLLLVSFISKEEMKYLRKLDDQEHASPFERSHALLSALKRLHSIEFIQSKDDLDQLPEQGDLKSHIELTEKGRKYLILREQLVINEPDR
jgi:hypothetical protein